MAYNLNLNDSKTFERISYLYYYKNNILGCKDCNIINPSPPKEFLKCFGGSLDYSEYNKKNIINVNKHIIYNHEKDPIKFIPHHIEEINIIQKNYELKRSKPLFSQN